MSIFKQTLALGVAAVALTACNGYKAPAQLAQPPAQADQGPEIGQWGFDLNGMDKSVAPGDDFVAYASGSYIKNLEIPADRSNYGMFTKLVELSEKRIRAIIDDLAVKGGAPGSNEQKISDYYASFMDEDAIEAKGIAPLQAELAQLATISTKRDLARAMGAAGENFGASIFSGYVNQDAKAPDHYIFYMFQSGLGLPDRDFYLLDKPNYVDARTKYIAHIAKLFTMAGVAQADAQKRAQSVFELEKRLAKVQWSRVDSRDDDKTYNKWKMSDFARKAPEFDWATFFTAMKLPASEQTVIVAQPSAIIAMSRLFASEPLAVWKDWMALNIIRQTAPLLNKEFSETEFAFSGTVLNGTPQQEERWKRGVSLTESGLGDAIGQIYVARYFPPEAKEEADKLVRNIIAAMDRRLANLDWMAPETRAKARDKLASFRAKIGYPDKWRDYSSVEIVRGDLFGNIKRLSSFEHAYQMAKLGKPVDRDEWFMTPQTVNAYANPTMNEIVFPAAILQAPFFDPKADPAVNYGGIGSVIGHEISHHFDDQGRKYDKEGKLTDWWTPGDVQRFKSYTDMLVAQYNSYEPLPGAHVNGELTLGENIADLAGVMVAFDAYHRALDGKEAPVADGYTGDQRFFLGYAQVWRSKFRDAALLSRLATDSHSPSFLRPYVVRNVDGWYKAFQVTPDQKLYLSPEKRVKPW